MKVLAISLILATLSTWAYATPATKTSFATELFHAIAKDEVNKNIIFSPVSIKTALGLTYLGAEGSTADEIKQGLQVSAASKEEFAQAFQKLFTKSNNGVDLKIANRVYVNQGYEIASKFNELASKYFNSTAGAVNFADSEKAANTINSWVEQNTNNIIHNIVSQDSLSGQTTAMIVNAIYFKADWRNKFEPESTTKGNFAVSTTRKVPVDMMYQRESFRFAELPDLDAIAIELNYYATDISMLIVLPNVVDGLASLENKLKNIDLAALTKAFTSQEVSLSLPKFKIEFDIELNDILKDLGMRAMFSHAADFSSLLTEEKPIAISSVQHKAFIEVGEKGTEAAAATAVGISELSFEVFPGKVYVFDADHPFFFAIKDNDNIYFAGHVVDF